MLSAEAGEDLRDELDSNETPYIDPASIPTRFSLLKLMAASPAHYEHACQRPQDDTIASRLGGLAADRKEALRFGTAVHLFLLGAADKVGRFGSRRAGKAWESFQAECAAEGKVEILSDREWSAASSVADSIRRSELAMRLLFDGTIVEQRIDWTFVGKPTRSTPDARSRAHLADLKTAITAEPGAFTRHALRLCYHAQAWLYAEAIEASGAPRPADAYIVAVEKAPPMPVSILRITERALEVGEMLCRGWIERLNVCEATGQWPAYLQDVGALDVFNGDDLGLEFNGRKVEL